MLMASRTLKFETPLRKGLTNTNHHAEHVFPSNSAKRCAKQEISQLNSEYILSYNIS